MPSHLLLEVSALLLEGGGMVVICNVGFVVGHVVGIWLLMVGGMVGLWVGPSSVVAGAPSFCEAPCIGLAYGWVHVGGAMAPGSEVGR